MLITSNPYGTDTVIKPKFVHVVDTCPRPFVNFYINDAMPMCQRNCIQFFDSTINGQTDPTSKWQWIFPGADSAVSSDFPLVPYTTTTPNPFPVCYSFDGVYDVTLIVQNQYGVDTLTKKDFITIQSVPGSYSIPDTTVLYGDEIKLYAGGGHTYQWLSDTSLLSTSSAVTVRPVVTTTYICIITDTLLGCSSYKRVTVTVTHNPNIFVPNAFAPDDPLAPLENRLVQVFANDVASMKFVIYDRWGEKLFESTVQSIGWDGTYNGKKCSPGIYIYTLEVTFAGGNTIKQNGNITLLR